MARKEPPAKRELRRLRSLRDKLSELDAQRSDLAEGRDLEILKLADRFSERELASAAGVHQSWVSKLKKRNK